MSRAVCYLLSQSICAVEEKVDARVSRVSWSASGCVRPVPFLTKNAPELCLPCTPVHRHGTLLQITTKCPFCVGAANVSPKQGFNSQRNVIRGENNPCHPARTRQQGGLCMGRLHTTRGTANKCIRTRNKRGSLFLVTGHRHKNSTHSGVHFPSTGANEMTSG